MGSVGNADDNALCESFLATLECELLQRRKFATKAEARMVVFVFIEGWYNPSCRHAALAHKSPIEFERIAAQTLNEANPEPLAKPGELQSMPAPNLSTTL